jgi:hypothetical protein
MNRKLSLAIVNINDFDFSVDKSKMFATELYDGSATIRLPGKNRRTANHELVLLPFFRKNKLKFQQVAIGMHKQKARKERIMVFDNEDLQAYNALIRKYGSPPVAGFVNSKGHVNKLMELLGVVLPVKPNQVTKIYFKLTPTKGKKGRPDYTTCLISLVKKMDTTELKKSGDPVIPKKPVKLPKTRKGPLKKDKKQPTDNFL